MSFLTRWFSKPKEDDYETILSNLANDIQKRRVRLSEIRLRERRATLLVTLYTLSGWVAYVSLWYHQVLPFLKGREELNSVGRLVQGIPVVLGPIIILFIRRIVQIWFARIGDAEEKSLREQEKTRRTKVEEIKKKTNYYSTRDLLQKYDAEQNGTNPGSGTPSQGPQPQTPQNNKKALPGHLTATPGSSISTRQRPGQNPSIFLAPPPQPVGPTKKQWYDRVADAVLGADPEDANSSSKFALICEQCFKHNGLVHADDWRETQYSCPKCGHFNSNKTPKSARTPMSAVSPQHHLPQQQQPQQILQTRSAGAALSRMPPVEPGDRVLVPTPVGSQRRHVQLPPDNSGEDEDASMMDVDGEEEED